MSNNQKAGRMFMICFFLLLSIPIIHLWILLGNKAATTVKSAVTAYSIISITSFTLGMYGGYLMYGEKIEKVEMLLSKARKILGRN